MKLEDYYVIRMDIVAENDYSNHLMNFYSTWVSHRLEPYWRTKYYRIHSRHFQALLF